MPNIEHAWRYQKAVYWAFNGYDDYGEPRRSATGVEIDVRWEDVNEEVIDSKGNTIGVDAVVVVDREIPVGSTMWKGEEADLPGTTGYPSSNIRVVIKYSDIPDIKGRYTRQLCYLMRLSDEMPLT